jgi:hypothetical protein
MSIAGHKTMLELYLLSERKSGEPPTWLGQQHLATDNGDRPTSWSAPCDRALTAARSATPAPPMTIPDYQTLMLPHARAVSPAFVERLVVDLLVKMGYGGSLADAGRAIGRTRDGGIDGIINEDRLGFDVIHIQAKRWTDTGRPEMQSFAGRLDGVRAKKGIFITTSSFSSDALEYVQRIEKRIVLIDGGQLAKLMFDFGVGVTPVSVYEIKRIDSDYFSEDRLEQPPLAVLRQDEFASSEHARITLEM